MTIPIAGPIGEPHADQYEPRDLATRKIPGPFGEGTETPDDVTRAQELLAWMRNRGFTAASIVVGGVQIHGLQDLYARSGNKRTRSDDPLDGEGWVGR